MIEASTRESRCNHLLQTGFDRVNPRSATPLSIKLAFSRPFVKLARCNPNAIAASKRATDRANRHMCWTQLSIRIAVRRCGR
ncbi:hypothetical protein RBSH_05855 [Rhodopirellula baltica SH28]|uniref:Uncharacterized protein n=1 Tax=Rhodopirellula baltica SH28 TaxID=993517 RepID=K5D8M7_RHOBT|nr:hypothetical protein RBSH_05855 [Rhodopirellula baltica SH28]